MDAKDTSAYERLDYHKRRWASLKNGEERANCQAQWDKIARVMSPRKAGFLGTLTAGENRFRQVLDPTGILALEMLAAGLHGFATNPASRWFSLRMVGKVPAADGSMIDLNKQPNVQSYLQAVEEAMWARIYQPGTNFTTALHEFYLDLGAFGTAILFISLRKNGGLIVECRSLAECVMSENSDGRIDTVYRETNYTVRQLVEEFGLEKVSPEAKQLWADKKYDDKLKVIHGVWPRGHNEREYGAKDPKNRAFASCYFEEKSCHLLEEDGFEEFPFLVGRWSKYSGEMYGRSPGMAALGDVQMLQAMALAKIKLVQKAADPPMWLRDDGRVGQTRTIPGGINFWKGNPNEGVMLQPVSLQGLQFMVEDIVQLREQILKTFFADLLRMTDRANMTATEVMHRTAEQMRLFGPLIGRLEAEVLGPLVERLFGILTRLGMLPKPPQEVQEQEFTVEYVSPIATAQKQVAAQSAMQAMQVVASIYGPELGVQVAMANVDGSALFKWAWDLFNCDPDLLKTEDAVQAEENMARTQQALQMAQPAAAAVKQGASAVRDISAAQGQEGGFDVQGFLAQLASKVQQSPRAQSEIKAIASGNPPPDPSALLEGAQ